MPNVWKKDYDDKRTRKNRISVYLSDKELLLLDEKAEIAKRNRSTFLRKITNESIIVIQDLDNLRKWSSQIGEIGRNVNQIAKKVNIQGETANDDIEEVKQSIDRLNKLFVKMAKEMINKDLF